MKRFQMTKKNWVLAGFLAPVVLFLFLLSSLGEDVKNEKIVVCQHAFTGKMDYWTTPGFKWQLFGKTTEYYKTQQFWFGGKNENGDSLGSPISVIFNDASDGRVLGSLRVKLPTDVEHLSRIQTDYNGMDRLMSDLVTQSVTKVIYASGPLMSAFESYAEKKNELIEYITDQLNYGVYKTTVRIEETIDPITGETKTTKIATRIQDPKAPGGYRRSEKSPFEYYGLEIGQVSIGKIDYSDKVNQQIRQQQEANMLIQTSKAKAAAAVQEAIRAEEEGKAAAAKAKWEQEQKKATAVTQAEQEREVSKLAAEKAEFDKKKIVTQGQAEAEANRLKVAAGLTPQERAEWEYKTRVDVAKALSDIQVPLTPYIVGGGNNGGNSPMDALGVNMWMQIVDKLSNANTTTKTTKK